MRIPFLHFVEVSCDPLYLTTYKTRFEGSGTYYMHYKSCFKQKLNMPTVFFLKFLFISGVLFYKNERWNVIKNIAQK